MSGSILAVECPQCKRVYNIYPGPDEMMTALVKRQYVMECDFCEQELTFKVLSTAKPSFSTGGA
ncbi:MAG: hypothetical protein ACRD2H_01400 [Terriglobales bacterium]